MGLGEMAMKYKARKSLEKALRAMITSGLVLGTAWAAKHGLDVDLDAVVDQKYLADALAAAILGTVYGALEGLRNMAKHRFGLNL